MSVYDGVVTLADDDIPVVVELNDGAIRLSASGNEIGMWAKDECEIRHIADGTYAISAENETLSFVPREPGLFGEAVDGASHNGGAPTNGTEQAERARHVAEPHRVTDQVAEAPQPKPLTVGLFYALCVLTASLAVWSVVSILT